MNLEESSASSSKNRSRVSGSKERSARSGITQLLSAQANHPSSFLGRYFNFWTSYRLFAEIPGD
jgi:hypothetical protein